jgi:acetyltransferase-like isoleucine patch superfamily enzyme
MEKTRMGQGVIAGQNTKFGENVVIWNYVVIGQNSRIDDGTLIGSFCDIGESVTIGKNCNIQAHVTISNACKIGNNVFIGPNSSLLNDKYPRNSVLSPPLIKNNVVVGGCATVLPGITIEDDAIIAAGSVVTKSIPSRTVVAGVPARPVMSLDEYREKQRKHSRTMETR